MATVDEKTPGPSPATNGTLGRRVLDAYRAFGLGAGVPALAYAAFFGAIYYYGDHFVSGEGWELLIALGIGMLVALGAAFVLHGLLALRRHLGWVHALVVVPLGVAPMLLAVTGRWPESNPWAWTTVTALAAPAVVALLTAPGLIRRAR